MKIRNPEFWALTLLLSALLGLVLASGAQAGVVIQSQPQSVVAPEGQSVTFTVTATSNRSIRYYWYKNGVMLGTKGKTLTVTASASNAATYSCLVVDGKTSERCADFTLSIGTVGPAPPITTACSCSCPGSAKLTWTAPASRADGSPMDLGSIAGYQLFAMGGPAIDAPATKIATLIAVSGYTIPNLTPGTHYFRLRTLDKSGLISRLSDVVAVTVK
jgi:hypothetical protein